MTLFTNGRPVRPRGNFEICDRAVEALAVSMLQRFGTYDGVGSRISERKDRDVCVNCAVVHNEYVDHARHLFSWFLVTVDLVIFETLRDAL